MQSDLVGKNDNPCGYDTLLIFLLLGNNLVHLHNPTIKFLALLPQVVDIFE